MHRVTQSRPRNRQRQLSEAEQRLERAYGPRQWHVHHAPVDELILTVLSQHTSDINAERAFRELRARYPSWEAIRLAPVAEIEDAIRCGGLARQKAPRLRAMLDAIRSKRGSLNLDHLATLPLAEATSWLTDLGGVGPKTAACVLLFSLGRPALPVDTHVYRVARRLGLIGASVDVAMAHGVLESHLGEDRDRVYAFHVNMIAHGRAVCTARRAFCERCPLTECCDYYTDIFDAATTSSVAPSG